MTTVKSLDLLSPLREPSSAPAGKETEEEEKSPPQEVPQQSGDPRSVRSRFQAVPWEPGAQKPPGEESSEERKVGTVRDRFRGVHWEPLPPELLVDEGLSKEEVKERAEEYSARKSVRSLFARMK